METLPEQFEAWQRYVGLAEGTIYRRRRTLARFSAGCDLTTARPVDIESWLGQFKEATTRRQYLGDLRAFYDWAIKHEHLTVDPARVVRPPKQPIGKPSPIDPDVLRAAIDAAPEPERTMLILAGFAGLRCIEISRLRLEDVSHKGGTLRVVGKGDRTRDVTMHPLVAAALPVGTGPAVTFRGKPITPRTVSDRLARYLHSRGIDKTGHKARHSYGTGLYEACHNLVTVAGQLGHANIATTRGYVAASDADARAAIAKLYEDKPDAA